MTPGTIEEDFVVLWRPVGPAELELIRQSSMQAFPPRLPEQPIFYPVLSEEYAVKIARDWNVPASGRAYVTGFVWRSVSSMATPFKVLAAGNTRNTGSPPNT